ncbi:MULTISPECIES: polysaccharide biosynthesis tyrosine autokinase [unclassified Pseudomonas]|uniref:GumC family protein n=1 Tax=unclassified Pseudomonas TaxID=196821 RepID=UPI002AC9496C|nr:MULTISPECIES: polysaccharide biosynthesis tyrosine autokinase [unclassified Pseudomonas]MEB0039873.1 polysaccharide biosynthesis tyrosine autokinase [Pseudomonas sp. MH10]MEB0077185.1 polysaccharide biosynthesis tyrosine autokinase [Pseudomonas sp. MH10out]MEB0091484.1 polysaccharide biosynthesis tyrosine autokinase [Pseudomonas sp. CCI4.2]MEB0101532.1 polysaccharide biosynthesis tyrosine autokinase [Pseudomonas sp. CCI3.2]MEB0120643.1 polysaccharide biosynthesis tyrosine autokinase [Pseudo
MGQISISRRDVPKRYMAPLEDDRDFIDSRKIGHTLWGRKWSILALAILATMLAAVLMQSITPDYRAVASLVIEPKGAMLISFQQTADPNNPTNDYLQTQISLIQSRAVAERAVRQLNLTEHPEFDPRQRLYLMPRIKMLMARIQPEWFPPSWSQNPPLTPTEVFDGTVLELMEHTSVSSVGKSQVVTIGVTLNDKETAALAANALAQGYLDSRLDAQISDSLTASRWMNTRLVELRTQLQQSENKLQSYRDAEGLVDVDGVVTISANELSKNSDNMVAARRERAEAQSQYQQVQGMGSKGSDQMSSIPAVINNPVIQQFQADEARAQAKVDELSRRYGDRHPKMLAARSDLAAAQASMRIQVNQVVAGLKRNYQLAQANEDSLRASVNSSRAQIQDISRKEFKLRELQRDVESNRSLYDTFLTRLRETTATADIGLSNARIVDEAIVPQQPNTPRKSLMLSIVAVLALGVGCALALLRDAMKNTFKSSDEVEKKLRLPVLGVVPLLQKKNRARIARQFERNDNAGFNEAIRTLRTGVMLSDIENRRRVVVVTSSVPGEGKSAVAVNLACALGRLERVLLIEADLRRPTLARNVGLNNEKVGLADLISGSARSEECIKRVSGIDVLPAGEVPSNPLELLASPRFSSFLEWAKQRYDRIIIDSPASQSVSDAALLCAMADAVLYVVKSDSTSAPQVQRGVGELLRNGAPVTGVVLNQVSATNARYGHQGYYGYLPGETT